VLTVRGISYLIGDGPDAVRQDLEVIARDLHCTTVMLIGGDGDLLVDAARTALEVGLDVYLRPDVSEMAQPKLLEHLDAVAVAAEDDPRHDLDRARFGVMAVAENGSCRPKEAFGEVARRYRDMRRRD
jgi:hypothetical protein